VEYWNAALEVSPEDPAILTGSAATHRALKQPDRAEELIRRAVAIEPTARRQTILACAIHDQLRFEESEQAIRAALLLDRNYADAAWLCGIWLLERWQFRETTDDPLSEAIEWLDWAAELAPANVECQISRTSAYLAAERLNDVICATTTLSERYPNVPEFHLHRSAARIKLGQLVQGYQEFGKWAYKVHRLAGHPFHAYPQWRPGRVSELPVAPPQADQLKSDFACASLQLGTGTLETDNSVCVWNVEGAGDYFQFIRFARAMAADGWQVKAICNKTMDRLFARVPGIHSVIAEDADIPEGTALAPLPILPAEYVGMAQLWEGPYLSADAATIAKWRQRLDSATRDKGQGTRDV